MNNPALSLTSGISLIRRRWLAPKQAVDECVAFERRFGPPHLRLACHAALPGILSPELLNLIHLNFLGNEQIPWIAEADFLLSRLCRPLGDGLYEVEPGVREVLLVELENQFGWERPAEVARFLVCYLTDRPHHWLPPERRQLLGWIAQAYLNPDRLLAEVKATLEKSLPPEPGAAADMASQLQVATLVELAAEPLAQTELQEDYQHLLHDSHVLAQYWYGGDETISQELAAHPEEYGDLLSPALHNWLRARPSLGMEVEEQVVGVQETSQEVDEAVIKKITKKMGPVNKLATVEITINLDTRVGQFVPGSYSIKGYGFNYRDSGELLLDYDTLLKLIMKSKRLGNLDNVSQWEDLMHEVGTTLGEQIYQEKLRLKQSFKKSFEKVLLQVGDIENLRIRFMIKGDYAQGIILEALTTAEKKFLMMQAPISYQVGSSYTRPFPLFLDPDTRKGPLNCLIIEADASGFVEETNQDLGQLDNLRDETDWLLHYLEKLQQAALTDEEATQLGHILRLTSQEVPPEEKFSDHLINILSRSGPWHLVHFAGHSVYHKKIVGDEIKGEGYFIFPGLKGDPPQALGVSKLSIEFRKASTCFLYLSSCYGGCAEFAIELANNFIPATLGFRWSVGDANALSHARLFYQHLFHSKDLEYALLKTRQELYHEHPADRGWAAAVLLQQLSGVAIPTPESDILTPNKEMEECIQAITHHLATIEDGPELLEAVAQEVARLVPFDSFDVSVFSGDLQHVRR